MIPFVSKIYSRLFPSVKAEDFWKDRTVVADLALSPSGVGASISPYVRTCGEILANNHKLKTTMHAFGTNVEGTLPHIELAVKDCIQTLHRQGVPRVSATLTICSRTDKDQSLASRMENVK